MKNMLQLPKGKRTYLVIVGFSLVTMLLIFDISTNYLTEKREYLENDQKKLKRQCENCVWGKRFKTQKIIYEGGRELLIDMLENVTVLSENQCKHKRFLLYRCSSRARCGGWADRQKGIVTTFLLALLTNRKFVIDMTSPCKLEHFLSPNVYNWSLCKSYLKSIPKIMQNVSYFSYIERYQFNKKIQNFDFETNYKTDVVRVRYNSLAIDGIRKHKLASERLKWLLEVTNEEATQIVLNTLFKPKDRLLNDAIHFYDNRVNGNKLICCHIRIGRNPSIPTDSKFKNGSTNETVIFEYLKQYDKSSEYAIYIAADSDEVRQNARNNFTSYININRTIVHIDRLGEYKENKTEACCGFYTAILEQLILSLCDQLIITQSGFGTIAAYMRGLSDDLYMYHPKMKQIVGTNLTNIQTVFKFL